MGGLYKRRKNNKAKDKGFHRGLKTKHYKRDID